MIGLQNALLKDSVDQSVQKKDTWKSYKYM